jgi:hypothetical protein
MDGDVTGPSNDALFGGITTTRRAPAAGGHFEAVDDGRDHRIHIATSGRVETEIGGASPCPRSGRHQRHRRYAQVATTRPAVQLLRGLPSALVANGDRDRQPEAGRARGGDRQFEQFLSAVAAITGLGGFEMIGPAS